MENDYIIVGCGLAGIVMAEQISRKLNKKVLIIEKRNHIGGNCYDYYDENGILVKNNVNEIKRAISKCILNKEIFSKKSIELFTKMYNLDLNKDIYVDYYKEIING